MEDNASQTLFLVKHEHIFSGKQCTNMSIQETQFQNCRIKIKLFMLHKTGFKTTPRLFQSWTRFALQVMCSSEEDRGGWVWGETWSGVEGKKGQPPVVARSGWRTDLLGGWFNKKDSPIKLIKMGNLRNMRYRHMFGRLSQSVSSRTLTMLATTRLAYCSKCQCCPTLTFWQTSGAKHPLDCGSPALSELHTACYGAIVWLS